MAAEKPIPAQLSPNKVTVEVGKIYAWCACGRSGTQPFCDGSHKRTGLSPVSTRPRRRKRSRSVAARPPAKSLCATGLTIRFSELFGARSIGATRA